MKLRKSLVPYLSFLMALFTSCSFQNNYISSSMPITDISADTKYIDLINQGYMGGSLIYNEKNTSLGHLSDGVSIAIRLSKAQRKDISDSEAVFQEQEDSVVYGLLVIDTITSGTVSLTSELYDNKGNVYLQKTVSLHKNESADLNDDGFADIQYTEPYFKRSGYEKASYLTFLSSQEDLNIAMYAVLPEQYPGKTYPNGIIGINNDDKFIVQKYTNSQTEQRSIITGIYKGDYVVDNKDNKYQKVVTNQYARHARSVDDDDLMDLEDEIDFDNTIFLFTDEDFAFSSPEEFLNVLPTELTDRYPDFSGLEKLNKILEDKNLFEIIDTTQGSILPESEKEEIISQFILLSTDETIQLNRVFLEKNYPLSCPQRVTVSTVITEVLPLACITFTESESYTDVLEDMTPYDTEFTESEARAASASFAQCKTEAEYNRKLKALEKDFNSYKQLFSKNGFDIPVRNDEDAKIILTLNNSRIAIGVKGSFSSVWGSVKSSLGAAAFFKVTADIRVDMTINTTYDDLTINNENTKDDAQTYTIKETLPVIKKDITLYEFELCQATNIASFSIGPIVIGISLDLGLGLPVKTTFEMDCEMSYGAYIAGIAKAGISVGVDYGVTWKRKWAISIPTPYINWTGNASATADAICYFDQSFKSADFKLNKLACKLSVEPYIKAGLSMSVAAVVHAGCGIQFGVEGYAKFGYYAPYLRGSCGLNNISAIYANAYLGLKGVKILGIKVDGLGKGWDWRLPEKVGPIVPETTFFEKKIN